MEPPIKIQKALGTFHGVAASVVGYDTWDIVANALVLLFGKPYKTLSGAAGYTSARAVCNCHTPKDLWEQCHTRNLSWRNYLREVPAAIAETYGISKKEVSALFTGADMGELEWASEQYEDLWVQAWVTAGFKNNAMRIGVDTASGSEKNGRFYPCGTINIIVVTNAALSRAALASSFITITEAKTVALQDLDIRSSFDHSLQATGTGTDQIAIASGDDFRCTYVGGHTKLGELMARAVTKACKGALNRQLAKDPSYHKSRTPQ